LTRQKTLLPWPKQAAAAGPDRTSYFLGGQNDFVVMVSNGAEWFVISSNRSAGNTRYYDGSGTYDIDMAVDVYLLSSFGGAPDGASSLLRMPAKPCGSHV
jgi:hypothetical protein